MVKQIQVDDVMLVHDETLPRQFWKLGKVMEVFHSQVDGVVRAVKIKTSSGLLRHSVDHLYPLEVEETRPDPAEQCNRPINQPYPQGVEDTDPTIEDEAFHGFEEHEITNSREVSSVHEGEDVETLTTRSGRRVQQTTKYPRDSYDLSTGRERLRTNT